MRILALIPARGGSKRLPGKNIRILGEKPLIAWTIEPAIQSGLFCDVLVSTDDSAIASVAERYGALVPWLRPDELATDTATSTEVAIHAVEWYESQHGPVDGLILLQPTSPFRTIKTLKESLSVYMTNGQRSVVSVTFAPSHPAWTFRVRKMGIEPFLGWEEAGKRSQDLEPAYITDGSVYIISPTELRKEGDFINKNSSAYLIQEIDEALDIDTEKDWVSAERILDTSSFKHIE